MIWKIKIEGEPRQKINVSYDPITETIKFVGLYKITNLSTWVIFIEKEYNAIETIKDSEDILFDIANELKLKIEKYEEFSTFFSKYKDKTIEVVDLNTVINSNNDEEEVADNK